ncbi:unnamed protein product [Spirodela intermedia]|uniref:U-box domain-containing protein n=2 Tax=Spirodela intermedia TaxID=51605 RepID=A0A7I8J150_SPIIN|nr:unnamed protein product [Spirodela intermedia]CAA6663769.1 unnamed protein product [Spirodela intermedia]CAA7400266.1 unnamed protein product [Spirodela intermedia]
MVRMSNGGGGKELQELQVTVPSFFRCPISLEVMKSPVSLCTGVTYDRSSIQTWLDAGHNTCPATMQVLPSKDLIPNHAIRRLIDLWSAESQQDRHHPPEPAGGAAAVDSVSPVDLLRELEFSDDPLPALKRLADMAADATRVLDLAENGSCIPALNRILRRKEAAALAVRVLSLVLLVGKEVPAEVDVGSLVHLMSGADEGEELVNDALSCLIVVSEQRRSRPVMVKQGAVGALGKVLGRESTPPVTAEKALRLMERASTCAEGRAAICEDPAAVAAVVGRMVKASPAAAEHAIVVLWTVCFLFRDRRALEAVAACNGLTKILLLMQSNCSAAAREMAGDLFKLFCVNHGGCLPPGYDLQTTHIMPF